LQAADILVAATAKRVLKYYLSIFLALDTGSGKTDKGDNAGNY